MYFERQPAIAFLATTLTLTQPRRHTTITTTTTARVLRKGGRQGKPRPGGRVRPEEETLPGTDLHGQRAGPGDGQHGPRWEGEALLRPFRGDRLDIGGEGAP